MKVGAVYKDVPENTNLEGSVLLLPWTDPNNNYRSHSTNWDDHNGECYVQLTEHVTASLASEKIKNLPTPFIKDLKETALAYPLDRMHLYGEFKNGQPDGGRIQYVILFGIIGAFVLFLACINFMNLSTARSSKRAKEVGIRKTIGSLSIHLVGQFLIESVLITLLAFGIAILMSQLFLPLFNSLAGKHILVPYQNVFFWLICLGFTLFTGVLAGSYPAFYLSSFEPIKVLKGAFLGSRYNSIPAGTRRIAVYGFIKPDHRDDYYLPPDRLRQRPSTGYTRQGLITIPINTEDLNKHYDAFREELMHSSAVAEVAGSSQSVNYFENNNSLDWRGKDPGFVSYFRNVNVTPEFGKTVKWKIISGRDFSREYADSSSMILSEAAAKITGIANPIGELMKFGGKSYRVVGVVQDMLTNSPYESVQPSIFLGDSYRDFITIRLKDGLPKHEAMANLEKVYKNIIPAARSFISITKTSMRINLRRKNGSATCPLYSPAWPSLFHVLDYSGWLPLLQTSVQRKSACGKCWVQIYSPSGGCYRCSL
jgi:hypothetical protein